MGCGLTVPTVRRELEKVVQRRLAASPSTAKSELHTCSDSRVVALFAPRAESHGGAQGFLNAAWQRSTPKTLDLPKSLSRREP